MTQRILWDGPWKFVFNGFADDELYNLERDPHESTNLAADPKYLRIKRQLRERMEEILRGEGDPRTLGHGEVFETILKLKEEIGLTILLVEQNVAASLDAADYVYVMHEGRIKAEGKPEEIKGSAEIREAYLGI